MLNELLYEDINKFLIYCKKSLRCVIVFFKRSVFAASHVVEEDHLGVLLALNFFAICAVSGFFSRVHVYDFSVSLVTEQKTLIGVRINSKVGGVAEVAQLRVPVIVRKVGCFGNDEFLSHENWSKVFGFHPVCKVDVTANFIFTWLLVPDEEYGGHSSISEMLLTPSKRHQKGFVFDWASCVRKSLDLSGVFVFLGLLVSKPFLVVLLAS